MVAVRRSTVIDAPVDAVWAVLRDFNGHDTWHPTVAASALVDGPTDRVGCERDFRLADGARVRERLLRLDDRARSFTYAISESDAPLEGYVAHVALKPVTDGDRTFWEWRSTFRAPPGRERELTALVAEGVYEAGFEAIRRRLGRRAPASGAAPASAAGAIEGWAMVAERHGPPEVLVRRPVAAPPPGPGEVRLRHRAIGVNYIDVYCRSGFFDLLTPPAAPGMEAAGEVIDVGPGVGHLRPGDRVGYACAPVGAYATVRTMPAALVFRLPDWLDDATAAAGLLKGMTAEFLLHRVAPVSRGMTALVYAPAGGVGRMLVQWARALGADVIGATSSEAKARIARDAGARAVVLPGVESLEAQVKRLTGGRGADVIFDAVGADSFGHSLAALAPCGHLVSYGQASGPVGRWDVGAWASMSATVSRPNFGHYTDAPEKVAAITERLFEALRRGIVKVEIGRRAPLSAAAEVHRALEARETTGATVLIPEGGDG